jgi:hypothetical protein
MQKMVLIWPVENLPRLSLTADGKDDGDRMQMIIVGWMDEDESSTAVIGAIISYSKPHKNLNKEVTSAIELLAEYHPCRTRQSDNDECGECSDCTTYQSLRVIAAFEEHIGAQKINAEKKHNEIIIYNPREANAWNIQYNQFRRQNNKAVGVLQRNLVRMSKSSAVFEELKLVLTNKTKNQLQQRIHNNSAVSIPPDYNTEPKCNTIVEENPDCFGKQSLLLLHWNTAAVDPTSDTFFFDRIPLFRALKLIWKERRCSTSSAALSLDFMLGLLIGFYLVKYPATILQQIGHMMAYHDQLFNENLQWLESFPAGFKLNVALTHRIGKEVRWILFYHKRLYSSIAAATATIFGDTISVEHIATTLLQNIGLCTALFGSRFCFAMAFDMTRLALLHIHLLSEVFATCLRFEMSALKSFWLLFTGKKRNVLRQRSDHLHYDHMQLLLGMILFSTCLFVFTTVLVYNWFFAVTNFGTEMIFCGILWFLHTSVEGGVQCERIILRRRWSRSNGIWTGKEVQFAPASLPESIRKMDTSYLMRFYDDKGSESKEIQSSLLPSNVSVEYQESCVLKIVFPSESDFSIVTAAMVSSISLVISRLPTTIVKRLLFGSPCNLAHSFIDFSNLLIKAKR